MDGITTTKQILSNKIKEALKKNWGDKADGLHCYAEVKFIDPLSSWCCYIFAMDKDEELIQCILYSDALGAEICTENINDIYSMYNEEGEHPEVDTEYRRMRVNQILKRLRYDT